MHQLPKAFLIPFLQIGQIITPWQMYYDGNFQTGL